ncbi:MULTISPECIES: TetR/AcrR family transcriptional regulator [Rhizobium]|uniref:AcrR family transcriptional regulator n=1 Tax=Rhizobium tropici TaxID=398 RepID=A0A6P1CDX7_RHITR|nr:MULTISPECIES: TetR/AcrR family transcriptional regulator [Rhizobium]MBB4239934.1 AcrR family transcriptional regulator [Rhizobium tropici]MBB5591204.1 AcrR family transcriptional regulator [Rhizobium tropici]MBB6490712.1 AcrR family transcriptional regulator [Rhizobium tropici]NEV15238.1 TetR/AcrR family transcriptional regulator [Rhizobium tropici]TGE98856.1 TetR/AcrR family transcriptional regulator [Rhizobium sp. SEMIA 4088]
MRYSAEHKEETRTRVVAAAGQVFRKEGYGGAGIDALTKAAGVTNGAFYGHFKSKSEAFRTAVVEGLQELRQGILTLRENQPKDWLKALAGFYLGYKRTCDLGDSCTLPSLSPDVMRADGETRDAYTAELRKLIADVAAGLPERTNSAELTTEDRAILLLATLSGGVTIARAVSDPALSSHIGKVIERAALVIGSPSKPHGE